MSTTTPQPPSQRGPAWDIARIFSDQGELSESEYLYITRWTRKLVEYNDGKIEVLPMPTTEHQAIVAFLYEVLLMFIRPKSLGKVLFAPLRVRMRSGRYREPDIVFMLSGNLGRAKNEYWEGADLVMEVVSSDDPDRDLVTKRLEYAESGIAEYWIIDPQTKMITVLKLAGAGYALHGEFAPGTLASSELLPGFTVDVNAVFAAAQIAG